MDLFGRLYSVGSDACVSEGLFDQLRDRRLCRCCSLRDENFLQLVDEQLLKVGALQPVPEVRYQTKNLHVVAVSQGNVQVIRDKHHRTARLIRFELLSGRGEVGKKHSLLHQCMVNIQI